MSCKVLAINGTADHIHVVLKIPSTITIAKLTKQLKGVSSHFINDKLLKDTKFKWQGGYGAFSISRWDVKKMIAYVKNQKEHHKLMTCQAVFEKN
jgi:REP element-mobilizing transposase RayT